MPLGREKVKLQWQVAPLGTASPALARARSAGASVTASSGVISGTTSWTDTLPSGLTFIQEVSGLTSDTPYHWRVRLLYRHNPPSAGRPPGPGYQRCDHLSRKQSEWEWESRAKPREIHIPWNGCKVPSTGRTSKTFAPRPTRGGPSGRKLRCQCFHKRCHIRLDELDALPRALHSLKRMRSYCISALHVLNHVG